MHKPFLLGTLLLLGSLPIAHADINTGEKLHQEHCVACHAQGFGQQGSEIYTRNDRRINSLTALHKQVNFCQNNLGLAWFEEEAGSVVKYLNQQYYHVD